MDTPRSDVVVPASAGSSPRMIENRVVLPAPFGPTSPIRSSRFTCNVTSVNNSRSPYALLMPDSVNMNRQFRHISPDSKAQNQHNLAVWRWLCFHYLNGSARVPRETPTACAPTRTGPGTPPPWQHI